MNKRAIFLVMLLGILPAGPALAAEQEPASAGRVEVVLADEHRKNVNEIKQAFAEAGLTNVHVQFMKAGRPPANIGIGPQVTAARARAAIRLAKQYNRGITILLPEWLYPDHYVTIASSSFDDTVDYPVNDEALKELENPSLTTEQFHNLYRRLTPADRPPGKKGRVF